MAFPITRMRRLRANEKLRSLIRETRLSIDQFIMPLFVCPGSGVKVEIGSMPGNYRMSVDVLARECGEIFDLGVPGVLLFGIPETKDEIGNDAMSDSGIVQQAVRAVKRAAPELLVVTDVCFCEYTSHGHCGVVINKSVDNDKTIENLAVQALTHARAGADMVAPSDMMDGRVRAIRAALDENGFTGVPIMSYAAKYASAFYGPFREAAGSTPEFGDRRSYQMDPANADEALRETALDIGEGADIVMVKPALAYLDVIYRVREQFRMPVAAYNVSGEYAMVKAAGNRGWIDEDRVMMEILTAIKRAGADIIISYFAKKAAGMLK